MWIALLVGEGMVLSVDGNPLAPILASAEPQNAAEEEVGDRMNAQRPVRQAPV
jgi:hypothetical protein